MLYAYFFAAFLVILVIIHYCHTSLRNQMVEGMTTNHDNPACKACHSKKYIEPPLEDNPLYLATLNAANIQFLQNKLEDYKHVKGELAKLQKEEKKNSELIKGYAKKMQGHLGGLAPKVAEKK